MCRLCGRVVKCIFDTMPSRTPKSTASRAFSTTTARARPSQRNSSHVSSNGLIRSALEVGNKTPLSAPVFLLPFRARLHQATATQQAAPVSNPGENQDALLPSMLNSTQQPLATDTETTSISNPTSGPVLSKPLVISKSLQELLPHLTSQTPHYVTSHIHRFPYLVTKGDTVRLPFHMHGVSSGDVLRLNRASLLGSRDYTLKAGMSRSETYDAKRTGEPNYLDERLFEVRARVMGIESGPMMIKEKTKRRNRKVKTVRSKHRYTVLKIVEVKVKTLEELMAEKGTVLLES